MTRLAVSLYLFLILCALPGCSGETGGGGEAARETEIKGPFEYTQGIRRMEQGNLFGASFLFEKAVAKYPDYLDARYKLAESYVALGKEDKEYFDRAFAVYDDIASVVGDQDLRLRLAIAKTYIAQGRADDAIALYEEILVERQEACAYWILLGKAEIQKAIILRGEEGLEAQMEQLRVAERSFAEALKLCPDNYDAYYGQAILLDQSKDYEGLVKLYEDLMKKFPDNPDPLREYTYAHYKKRDWKGAAENFKKLLERDLRESERLMYMVALNKLGRKDEEERQGKIYLANQPKEMGPVHRTKLDILQEQLKIPPRTDRAGTLFEEGKYEEALVLWREVRAEVVDLMNDAEFGEAAQEQVVWLDRRIQLAQKKISGDD